MENPPPKVAVVGVDLGTAYSGIAVSYTRDPTVVNASSPNGMATEIKEPTAMLRRERGPGQYEWLFGRAAIDAAIRSMEDDEAHQYPALFRNFKIKLMSANITDPYDEVIVSAENIAVQTLLLTVYVECLKVLKNHALTCIARELGAQVRVDQVLWVLTVPGNTTLWAKGFMREAACRAGMTTPATKDDSKFLCLLLEPEAATIALSHAYRAQPTFAIDRRILVVDGGGGTVDLCTLQLTRLDPPGFRSVTRTAGGLFGSENVNISFRDFLLPLLRTLSPTFEAELRGARAGALHRLLRDFNTMKCTFDPAQPAEHDDLRLNLRDLLDEHRAAFAAKVQAYNDSAEGRSGKTCTYNATTAKLTLSRALFSSFFERALQSIVDNIQRLLDDASVARTPVDVIAVIGGFAASRLLTQRLMETFGGRANPEGPQGQPLSVLFPSAHVNPQAAVVIGAARYGNYMLAHPDVIINRIIDRTYGIGFRSGDRNIFRRLVVRGENVAVGHCIELSGHPQTLQDTYIAWKLYSSEIDDPEYLEDAVCLGRIEVPVQPVGATVEERNMTARVTFGDCEVRVFVTSATGEAREMSVRVHYQAA